ncbi:MAG: gamma-glutamyl-gamma-aminobutyrate hydrolase family protein [Bacteroidota bacterium]
MSSVCRISLPVLLIISALSLAPSSLYSQAAGRDTILVFHPTAETLKTLDFLIDNHLLDLEDYHFQGVGHKAENYDYELSSAYIATSEPGRYSLSILNGALDPGNLYRENTCSNEFRDLFHHSVGALFFGGPDIPPRLYDEDCNTLTVISDPGRHYLEASYIWHLLGNQESKTAPLAEEQPFYVISGICLGMQTINVATGGTLVQDIPSELYDLHTVEDIILLEADQKHRNYLPQTDLSVSYATSYHFHHIVPVPGEILDFGHSGQPGPEVLSSHHQAVKKPGKGLRAVAWSADGKIMEALSHEDYPGVIGVQFHPENPALYRQEVRWISADSSISFYRKMEDQQSGRFHRDYWSYISSLIKRSSENRQPLSRPVSGQSASGIPRRQD